MKVPLAAPDWRHILATRSESVLALRNRPEVMAILQKANARYDYWEKFRSQPFPAGVDKEETWALLKLIRTTGACTIPLEDLNGNAFWFWTPHTLNSILHEVDQLSLGELDINRCRGKRGGAARHLIHSLMEEAITSSQVEGAATTLRDAKKMLRSQRRPRDRSEQMIYNNYLTMQSIKDYAERPMTPELLKEIHRQITEGTLVDEGGAGRYRRLGEDVRVESVKGETLFVPPPANELEAGVGALCDFANADGVPFIHPIVRAIILHFWLAYLHPFIDGNGRTARALFYWYLIKSGYWYLEYISISKVILGKIGQYGRAYLYTEADEGDLTYFLHYNLKIIGEAIDALKAYLIREVEEVEHAVAEVSEFPDLNPRQSQLAMHALTHPSEIFTIKGHQTANGIAYQTARTDLLRLEEVGLLRRIQKGKTFYFVTQTSQNQ